ncbi:MAG: AAA family ATPase [Bryobacteraceae bacterium]
MPRILGFRVQNYRVLRDVTIGHTQRRPDSAALTPLAAVIGKNGTGKSTLFDALGFLKDCLDHGVEAACEMKSRGGFGKLRSAGTAEPVSLAVSFAQSERSRPFLYQIMVTLDQAGRPFVALEQLAQHLAGERFRLLLHRVEGHTSAWLGQKDRRSQVRLADSRRLGIAALGLLRDHPEIAKFRRYLEGWHLSYFTPDAARSLSMAGPQKHLNVHGDNLGNVVEFMQRQHPDRFKGILSRIAKRIPGIKKIDTKRTDDGRLLLRFNDRGFEDPFYAQQVSDGTLKVFAYLLLLEDPDPPSFLCIEEPENGLYHRLLETLAREFREHSANKGGPQIFVTTHQPYFVDALDPSEVWLLEKGKDGFATIRRAADDPVVAGLAKEGVPLGSLWYSQYLDKD